MNLTTTTVFITAMIGVISGIGALYKGYKDSKNTASQGYVDQNLAIMQRTIEYQAKEDLRLRELNEKRLRIIEDLENQVDVLTKELEETKKACNECLQRVSTLEKGIPS